MNDTTPLPSRRLDFRNLQETLSRHMSGLDALRGIAILLVVWHNCGFDFELDNLTSKLLALFTNSGWVGVQLFFVLSGFLITGLLIDGKGKQHHLRNFYIRRSLRIFPIYYLTLAFFFIGLPLLGDLPFEYEKSREMGFYFWTYTINWTLIFFDTDNGFQHYWSLAIEEQFYLCWPFVVLFCNNRSVQGICLFLITFAISSRYYITYAFPEFYLDYNYTWTIARVDSLAIGALLAVMLRNKASYEWVKKLAGKALLMAVLLSLFIVVITEEFSSVGTGIAQFNQTLAAVISASGIYYLIQPANLYTGWWQTVTSVNWLNQVGKYSYAIYIFHLPIKEVLKNTLFLSTEGTTHVQLLAILFYNFGLVLLISTILAVVSWHLVEGPALTLKKLFR